MANLNAALEAFLADQLSFDSLLNEVERACREAPGQAPAFLKAAEAYYRRGRLPPQIYQAISDRLTDQIDSASEPLGSEMRSPSRTTGGSASLPHAETPPDSPASHLVGQSASSIDDEPAPARSAPLRRTASAPMPTDTIFRPPGTAPIGIGSTINRRFVLESLIARGGMGIVFKAKDLRKEEADDRDPYVAVKILTEDFRRHPDALITLQREAKKAQKLAHPNIVTVYDFDRDGDTVYMTMELLEGEPLPQVIKRAYPSGLPAKEAFAIIEGICLGLAYAHKQHIVHSDLKPGNVFVTKEGVAKVLDFGIARAARQPGQLQQDATVFDAGRLGAYTPAYASCDMLEGADPDPRDDIFALACVSYELLTGRHPFAKAPSTQARDNKVQAKPPRNLSREQWRGLLRGLAFARDRRTPTVEEFLRELRPKTPGSARRWVYGTGGAALGIALAAFVATSLMQSQNAEISSGPCDVSPGPLAAQLRPKVRTLIEVANVHFLVGRIMEPPGSSAFDAYRRVLELHPHNAQACAGLESIARHYEQQAQENIASGRIDDARVQIDNGLRAQPNDARLLKLQQEYGT